MSSSRMTDGVGKKIVEALKQQSDIEINPVKEDVLDSELNDFSALTPPPASILDAAESQRNIPEEPLNLSASFRNSDTNFQSSIPETNLTAAEEMDLPSNVAVLRQLITKIPSGVSKQTGALIIKQTMEALGISMSSVLQEAQQVQEKLTQSVRECQTNVLECKKQIGLLELQAQKYQRQFAAVNDIVSLFIQTAG